MRKTAIFSLLFVGALGFAGCDLLSSQNVENPELTQEQALSNPDPLERWTTGLDRQLAIAINRTVDWTSIATDNYENTNTFYNQIVDDLDLNNQQTDIEDSFFSLHDLRSSALFGKNTVVPADDSPSAEDIAELDFYFSMAHIMLGETYHASPLTDNGTTASSSEHFEVAIDSLQNIIDSGNGDQVAYRLAQARAYYNNGNLPMARQRANEVLNMDSDFIRFQDFDPQNTDPEGETDDNVMENALYDRQGFDDFQPLPRLDFLDPKVATEDPQDSPMPLLKAEEAHLILVEAELAEGDIPGAKTQMNELLTLVQNERDSRTIDESIEGRTEENPGSRPDTTAVEVRASDSDPYRSGLVLNRNENTSVASVSNTSITNTMVNNLSNSDAAAAWEMYYLLRQEIFMAEGRRFATIGLKAAVPFTEADINPNITPGSDPTEPIIPDYIMDAVNGDGGTAPTLDSFSYTEADENMGTNGTFEATIDINLNRVLANNRQQVSPFLQ